jgi:hypothetical protein
MARTANARSLGNTDPLSRPYSTLPAGVQLPGDEAVAGDQGNGAVSIEMQEVTYRYLVSFYSEASGIDYQGLTTFETWVVDYGKNLQLTIAYDKIPWGREGETEVCFKLSELNEKQQAEFVAAANEKLKSVQRVHTYENQPCKHQKRP